MHGLEAHAAGKGHHLKRRVHNLLAFASLTVGFTIVVLWVRSYRVYDAYLWERSGPQLPHQFSLILSRAGVFTYGRGDHNKPGWFPKRGYFVYWNGIHGISSQATTVPAALPFKLNHWILHLNAAVHGIEIQVPYLPPTVLSFLYPLFWLMRWIRQRRIMAIGRCHACGYDLRASVYRCPECGKAIPKAAW